MKRKAIVIFSAAALLAAAFLAGFGGLITLDGAAASEETRGGDRLVGVCITPEYLDLFDFEAYFNENADKLLNGGEIGYEEQARYGGRVYAQLCERPYYGEDGTQAGQSREYVFEGIEGILYMAPTIEDENGTYTSSTSDEGLSDGHMAISVTDEGEEISLEGTIYASSRGPLRAYYLNPVYQTPDGAVYLVAGTGMSYGSECVEGLGGSTTLSESTSVTENGETTAYSAQIKVNVSFIAPPERVCILMYNDAGELTAREEYAPDALPESVRPRTDTEYIITVSRAIAADGEETSERMLFTREDESLFAFSCREDGICVKKYVGIAWGDGQNIT